MVSAIDSNIPIYALLDSGSQGKSEIARSLLIDLTAKDTCIVSTQVLKEFASVATRKFKVPQDELLGYLNDLNALQIVDVNSRLIEMAVRRHFASHISFYDALVVEAAKTGGAEVLYSEDLQHGMQFDSLRIVNPFL